METVPRRRLPERKESKSMVPTARRGSRAGKPEMVRLGGSDCRQILLWISGRGEKWQYALNLWMSGGKKRLTIVARDGLDSTDVVSPFT